MQMRSPKEVEKQQYHEFYKKTFNDFLEPLSYTHFTTEVSIFPEYCSFFSCDVQVLGNQAAMSSETSFNKS
jgi:HSP90 family molecular chaperone